ncbi:MAG: hypothetical protein KIT46_04520 [Anaerolineales bacterium]|nr:hypothetical protein [Anaerolineales bacterium]MCW5855294.1 hypothetical protein [Anaerolineales bacterium]
MLDSYRQIDQAADALAARGVELDAAYKRRDRREPGRAQKERLEDRLAKAVRQLFAAQQAAVLYFAEGLRPSAKSDLWLQLGELGLSDEEAEAAILLVLSEAGAHATELFAQQASIGLDLALYQTLATGHVRSQFGELITNINQATLRAVQEAVALYLETPGMRLRDLVEMLPFGKERAILVARTEITQAYGEINRLAGEQLARDFPDVEVVETWFTNRAPNVCPVCQGLDGVSRRPGEPFVHRSSGQKYHSPRDTHPGCGCWTHVRTAILEEAR